MAVKLAGTRRPPKKPRVKIEDLDARVQNEIRWVAADRMSEMIKAAFDSGHMDLL